MVAVEKVQVRIEGSYTNGHSYDRIVTVEAPTLDDWNAPVDDFGGPLTDWWEQVVFNEIGDGQPGNVGSYHKATVFAPGEPWDNATYEWMD